MGGAAQPTIAPDSEDEVGPGDDSVPGDDYAREEDPVIPNNSVPEDDSVSEEHSVFENDSASEHDSSSAEYSPPAGGARRRNPGSVSRQNYDDEAYSPSDSSSSGTSSSSSRSGTNDTALERKISRRGSDASSISTDCQGSDTQQALRLIPINEVFELYSTQTYPAIAVQYNLKKNTVRHYLSCMVRRKAKAEKRTRKDVKDELNARRLRNGVIKDINGLYGVREYRPRGEGCRIHGPRTTRDSAIDAVRRGRLSRIRRSGSSEEDAELESPSDRGELSAPEARGLSMESSPESHQADIEAGVTSAPTSPRGHEDQDQATESQPKEPNALVEAMESMANTPAGVRTRIVVGGTEFVHENVPVTIVHQK